MAPDASWTNCGSNPLAGTRRGWDEIAAMFGKLMKLTGFTDTMAVRDIWPQTGTRSRCRTPCRRSKAASR